MKIITSDSKLACSAHAADIILNEIKRNKKAVLGLATGSTVEDLYDCLIKKTKSDGVDWSGIRSFNLDEYVGLKEDEYNQSYRYFMDSKLFDHININKANTNFPIKVNDKAEANQSFANYDEAIKNAGGIDIQVLGIGNNGHIAFNEPGSSIDSLTRCVQLTPSTIKANSRFFASEDDVPKLAISMGLRSILNSKKIILLAFGENKREALNHLINAKSFDPNWPCTCLHNHSDLIVITDLK